MFAADVWDQVCMAQRAPSPLPPMRPRGVCSVLQPNGNPTVCAARSVRFARSFIRV